MLRARPSTNEFWGSTVQSTHPADLGQTRYSATSRHCTCCFLSWEPAPQLALSLPPLLPLGSGLVFPLHQIFSSDFILLLPVYHPPQPLFFSKCSACLLYSKIFLVFISRLPVLVYKLHEGRHHVLCLCYAPLSRAVAETQKALSTYLLDGRKPWK